MKAFSNEIKIAIETVLAIYNSSPEFTVKNEETGFTVELVINHATDHLMKELEHHIKYLTGQRIISWDVLPENENKVKLVIGITNGWEPIGE